MMQEGVDSGVCVHHASMCKLIEETHEMTKEVYDFIMGQLGKKGMASQHFEMYEFFLENKNNKKSLVQHAAAYMLSATLGGLLVLIGLGIRAAL